MHLSTGMPELKEPGCAGLGCRPASLGRPGGGVGRPASQGAGSDRRRSRQPCTSHASERGSGTPTSAAARLTTAQWHWGEPVRGPSVELRVHLKATQPATHAGFDPMEEATANRRWRHLAVVALAVMVAIPAGPVAARDVENLDGAGLPSCTFVGLAGDLDVMEAAPTGTAGSTLPDLDQGNAWQPVAEGPLVGVKDTLTGTWELSKEPFGTAQVRLRIGKKVGHETQNDESGSIQIAYYAMTGTVTVDGVAYPITGCRSTWSTGWSARSCRTHRAADRPTGRRGRLAAGRRRPPGPCREQAQDGSRHPVTRLVPAPAVFLDARSEDFLLHHVSPGVSGTSEALWLFSQAR